MSLIYKLLYLYLILRPYYLFDSGGIQISDLFLIAAFFVLIIITGSDKREFKEILKKNRGFILFTFLTLVINTIYCISYPDKRFVMSTIYYIFNCCAIILFYMCFKHSDSFSKTISKIFKVNLILQLLLLIIGLGRYWHGIRYMGSFNDPNQFGYYVLISYCFIYLLSIRENKKITLNLFIYFAICAVLIAASISTGMFLGLGVLAVLMILTIIKNPIEILMSIGKKLIIILIFLIPVVAVFYIIEPNAISSVAVKLSDMQIFSRVEQKINRAKSDGTGEEISILQDRALDYVTIYPQYMIYGAGEGGEDRFEKVFHKTEIHSTFPAILFYYGLIPTYILIRWIYENIKKIRGQQFIIYIALLAESFTLANQRQALFWIIIVLATFLNKETIK